MTWITKIGFRVWTDAAPYAGTDNLVLVNLMRDGDTKERLRLDYAHLDDLEPNSRRFYGFQIPRRHLDKTKPLPDGIGQIPSPYPATGIEFSADLRGHLKCQLEIKGDDLWIKDRVDIYVKYISLKATSFDTVEWLEDAFWTRLGIWGQDVTLSRDSGEGFTRWNLVY